MTKKCGNALAKPCEIFKTNSNKSEIDIAIVFPVLAANFLQKNALLSLQTSYDKNKPFMLII